MVIFSVTFPPAKDSTAKPNARCTSAGALTRATSLRISLRLTLAAPNILELMTKIAVIISICGLAGVNLVMVFPSLLQIYSKKRCYELFERHATPYTGFFSADVYPYLMLVFALVTAGLGLFSLIQTIQET